MATLTLWGIENYLKSQNKSVFDGLVLPDGIVKNDVVDNIMLRAGEFEVLYSNPDFLTEAIAVWGRKHFRTFSKWYEALQIEYNPLENYDRQEEWTDNNTHSGSESSTATSTDNITSSQTANSQSVTQVSAFDSSTFSDRDKTVDSGNSTNNNTSEIESNSNGSNSSTDNGTHTGRVHGNIGVTTSQQMLESELNLSKWNLIDNITDLYICEFCVAVY